jgi:cell division septum initiation protein DivIVA
MKFSAREGGILAESAAPSGAASLLDALRAAQEHFDGLAKLHADTERKCAAMLASARADAKNILGAARAKADKVDARLKALDRLSGRLLQIF